MNDTIIVTAMSTVVIDFTGNKNARYLIPKNFTIVKNTVTVNKIITKLDVADDDPSSVCWDIDMYLTLIPKNKINPITK